MGCLPRSACLKSNELDLIPPILERIKGDKNETEEHPREDSSVHESSSGIYLSDYGDGEKDSLAASEFAETNSFGGRGEELLYNNFSIRRMSSLKSQSVSLIPGGINLRRVSSPANSSKKESILDEIGREESWVRRDFIGMISSLDRESDSYSASQRTFEKVVNSGKELLKLLVSSKREMKEVEADLLKKKGEELEKKAIKRTHKLNRLCKIGSSRRIESSDEASLGDQEDASKQGRIIDNLVANKGVTLVDETQGRNDQDMFETGVLDDEEVVTEKEVSIAGPVTTVGEAVTTVGVEVSVAATTPTISIDDITLAKALVALKSLQDIYEHVMEIPLQRIEDIKMEQKELKARNLIAGGERASLLDQVASLERSNVILRGSMMMEGARADRFRRRMSFMKSKLRLIVEPVVSSSISVNQIPHYGLNVTD
nr:hypothetical protein [Tanacetum cinerariifolium]